MRYAHSGTTKTRGQTWNYFLRFVKALRRNFSGVSEQIIRALGDLLVIKALLPSDLPEDENSSTDGSQYEDSQFNSQLSLFEAVGCVASASSIPVEGKVVYIQSIMNPLFVDIEQSVPGAKTGDERSIIQIHHDIMAAGSFSHGFNEWKPGAKTIEPLPAEVVAQFVRCGEIVLTALEELRSSKVIRGAARHSFSRLLGCTGNGLFPQLRRWVDCIVSPSSSKEEISFFIRLLSQIVFAFKTDISNFFAENLSLLLERVFDRMTEQALGTDDEHELRELRQEFLSFIMVCLNNNLGGAFILPQNQAIFEKTVSAIESFAKDPTDLHTARLALGAMTRMIGTWAGTEKTNGSAMQTSIPQFDNFAIQQFSPIVWAIPASQGFKPTDAGARLFLQEIAAMQYELYKKTGVQYIDALRGQLLQMGVSEGDVNVYLEKLDGDVKGFREFLVGFMGGK